MSAIRHPKRLIVLLLLAVVVAFAGYRIWQAYEAKAIAETKGPAAPGSRPARVVSVSQAEVTTGPVREAIEITGSLKPKEQVDVTPQITGRVKRLSLQVGDTVRRGDPIAELEDEELAQQVRRAEAAQAVVRATLEQRKAELANAKSELDRAAQLTESGLIARQEYDTRMTAYHVMQSQLALTEAQGLQAAAESNELRIRLQQMQIRASISGHVAQRFVDLGAVVTPTTPIIRVVNLSTMVTVANVNERDVAKLRTGQQALVHVDAYGNQPFPGRVARIAPVLDPATRTASVEIEIPNASGALKAEMFARVELDLGATRQARLIPREALVYRGTQPGVFLIESENRPVFRPIQAGDTQGSFVEVLSDLAVGTPVISRGAAMLTEGDRVRVVGQENAGPQGKSTTRATRKDGGASAVKPVNRVRGGVSA